MITTIIIAELIIGGIIFAIGGAIFLCEYGEMSDIYDCLSEPTFKSSIIWLILFFGLTPYFIFVFSAYVLTKHRHKVKKDNVDNIIDLTNNRLQ